MRDDDARERVLTAAGELFYAKGFGAVGMDELRSAAGVSLRRVYQQFSSKDEIILEFLRGMRTLWETKVGSCVEAAGSDPRQRVLAIFTFLDEWFHSDGFRGCAFINAFGELGATHPDVAQIVREHKEASQEYIGGLVRDAGGDDRLTSHLWLLFEGAQTSAAIKDDPTVAHEAREAAAELLDHELAS